MVTFGGCDPVFHTRQTELIPALASLCLSPTPIEIQQRQQRLPSFFFIGHRTQRRG